MLIESERVYLREVTIADATPAYLSWLQDSDVSRYLECRHQKQSLESIKEFIENALESKDIIFLAIITKEDDKHIGNVKIGPIDRHNNNSPIGIIIGEKSYWGKGYGTEAEKLAVKFAFEHEKLHRITASVASYNASAIKVIERIGFKLECRLKDQAFIDGAYCDGLIYGIINGR